MSSAVDESAKLEVLEAIGETLGLSQLKVGKAPESVRPAAEALLLMSSDLWAQATLVRKEPMGHGTMAGLHPVLRALIGMDEVVWDTLGRLRPKYVKALTEKSTTVRDFILKSAAVALSVHESVPIQSVKHTKLEMGEEEDAQTSVEAFHRNYIRHRPARLKTQADVAKAAGISIGTVATIEKMKAKPHHATIAKLAKAFGVSVEEMLG
jgi:DNA-binding XRE family transcriptional regulator